MTLDKLSELSPDFPITPSKSNPLKLPIAYTVTSSFDICSRCSFCRSS